MLRVVLLAMLLLVPGSCADDMRSSSDQPGASDRAGPDAQHDIQASLDPFITGSTYRFVMKVTEKEPGLGQKSTATLKIALGGFSSNTNNETDTADTNDNNDTTDTTDNNDTTDTDTDTDTNANGNNDTAEDDDDAVASGNSSETFVADTEARVEWTCGDEQHRGYKDISIRSINDELTVKLDDLPALQDADDSFSCDVDATLDATLVDGERVIATGSQKFYVEVNVPALKIHEVEIAADTTDATVSVVDFKIALLRKGEAVKSGDAVFDNKVTVKFGWECNDSAKTESKNKTYVDIPEGKGEATAKIKLYNTPEDPSDPLLPSRPVLEDAGYACLIEARSEIEGYDAKLGSKKIWIEGKDLQVAVTEVTSSSIKYAVMARYQKLAGNVNLSIVNIADSDSCKGNIDGGGKNVASSGTITITGSGTDCKLRATAGEAAEQRAGESKPFKITTSFREGE